MAYVKPYTYVDGTVVDADQHHANDASARKAINQGILATDLALNVFDYDSIQRGEYEPTSGSHQFTTGDTFGLFSDELVHERSYFTSETKANDQIGSTQYQDIYNTGTRFEMEIDGDALVTFGGAFISEENISNAVAPYDDGSHPGRGQWDSSVYLRFVDEQAGTCTYLPGTLAYTYEETSSASAGTTDPGAGGITARRWIGFQWMLTDLTAGNYQVCVVINPKVEQGYCASRQFTLETFYV